MIDIQKATKDQAQEIAVLADTDLCQLLACGLRPCTLGDGAEQGNDEHCFSFHS